MTYERIAICLDCDREVFIRGSDKSVYEISTVHCGCNADDIEKVDES